MDSIKDRQNNYKGICTTEYDTAFTERKFRWFPWVGKNYDNQRILVLGASMTADWDDGDETIISARKKEMDNAMSEFQRAAVIYDHGIKSIDNYKYQQNFLSMMLAKDRPTVEDGERFWRRTAFHNAIQETMFGKDTIVNEENSREAWQKFQELVEILKPRLCIMWGAKVIDYWSTKDKSNPLFQKVIKGDKNIGGKFHTRSFHGNEIEGINFPIEVIHHPSVSFISKKRNLRQLWAEHLIEKYPDQIGTLRAAIR